MIWELRRKYEITKLLTLAKLPRSSYYYYLRSLKRPDKYKDVKKMIASDSAAHKGRYGYRRMTFLLRQQGYIINHKTVQRLMRELNLVCRVRMKKYHSYHGEVAGLLLTC